MNDFLLALNVVFPLFIYMLAGVVVRGLHLFSEDNFRKLGTMNFKCFIPLTLLFNAYNADIEDILQPKIFLFSVLSVLAVFFIFWGLCGHFIKDKRDAASMSHGIYRSNYVLFGTTIGAALCTGHGLATISAMAAIIVPLFNILAVVVFAVARQDKVSIKEIIIGIFTNTLVDAAILGVILNVLHIHIPQLIQAPLVVLGQVATPVALISLGGILSLGSILSHKKYLTIAVVCKLIAIPLVVLATAVLLGFRGDSLVIFLAIFATPTAVSATPMATTLGGNGKLTGEIVATTSVCSILTLFLFSFGLSCLGLI